MRERKFFKITENSKNNKALSVSGVMLSSLVPNLIIWVLHSLVSSPESSAKSSKIFFISMHAVKAVSWIATTR